MKNPPYLYTSLGDDGGDICDGFEYYYIKTLSQILNFTFELKFMSNIYGKRLSTGNWNGIIGSLSKNVSLIIFDFKLYNELGDHKGN